ncbi:MAG: hypothetical protein CL608_31630 [Anaerolineaceae bacterium]|nr:hypothetical protein [Anaerolineaceae bacterium]
MKGYLVGGISGAVGGLVAGGVYAAVTGVYSIIATSFLGLMLGGLAGMLLALRVPSGPLTTRLLYWVRWFFFVGFLSRLELIFPYAIAALFGLLGVIETQPDYFYLLATCLLILLSSLAGAVGGLISGLLFNYWPPPSGDQ